MKTRMTHCIRTSLALAFALGGAVNARADADFYQRHNLVSDGFVAADHLDPNLVNAWGIAFNPTGPVWVSNNGSGTSTLYDGTGVAPALIVQIPTPTDDTGGGNPTGIIFNASTGFVVSKAGVSGPSRFIFATEDGVIAGWASNVDTTHAIRAVDNSTATGAIYKGIALSAGGTGQLLYATDFHNGRVDVFDATFKPATLPTNAFVDPSLPSGFAPFGIQAINGNIYVTYALQDDEKHDDVHGPGLGYVDVYDPNGHLLHRVASRGHLNSPWGVTLAPAGFGKFSNTLLIGNFGDGLINAYDPVAHPPSLFVRGQNNNLLQVESEWLGNLRGQSNQAIQIDGVWGISFGNGFANQPVNTLFFAAGPADESHGLYGRIDAIDGNNDGH